jgi:hypothetical protein
MKKRACISLLALSFLVSMLAVAPTSAKSVGGLKAHIPFDFNVGSASMAAGEYTINSITSDGAGLRISGAGGDVMTLTVASLQANPNRQERARLIFHKYGEQYFLAAVWNAEQTGRALPESKRERNLRKERRVAQNNSGGAEMEIVTIDLR